MAGTEGPEPEQEAALRRGDMFAGGVGLVLQLVGAGRAHVFMLEYGRAKQSVNLNWRLPIIKHGMSHQLGLRQSATGKHSLSIRSHQGSSTPMT